MIIKKRILNINVHFAKKGAGKPVILLHGWGCDMKIFESISIYLAREYTVYIIDLPGFGESEKPTTIWGTNEYTLFLDEFIQVENIQNPILIGHSFGGKISLSYASKRPVEKAVLICSAGIKPQHSVPYQCKFLLCKLLENLTRLFLPTKKGNVFIEKLKNKLGSDDYKIAQGVMKKILLKIIDEDMRPVMPSIKVPTLLIWGDLDITTPLSNGQIMKMLIPNSRLIILKNTDHFCFLKKPFEFLTILGHFLRN